jgi:arginine-tRNA-protein transferase
MSKTIGKIPISFYLTAPHECPYLDNREAQTLFLSPEIEASQPLYDKLIQQGFRRSGEHIYRPHCATCDECKSSRIPVTQFEFSRRYKRTEKKAEQIQIIEKEAVFTVEHFQLYDKYIACRHRDGDMYPPSIRQYKEFILCPWLPVKFLEMRTTDGRLIGCAVFDRLEDGLSALYTYFDPDYSYLSLGRLAVLTLIRCAIKEKRPYVYLGYWIRQSPKMAYKCEYAPLEIFEDGQWRPLPPSQIR